RRTPRPPPSTIHPTLPATPHPAALHSPPTSSPRTPSPSRHDALPISHPRPPPTPAVTPSLSEYPTQWRAPRPRLSRRTTTRTASPPRPAWESPSPYPPATRLPPR